jgi:hypothetical protein
MKYSYSMCKLSAVLCLVVLLISCKREIIYEGPMGALAGKITLAGFNVKDNSGVLVTIDGTSPALHTTTNEKGEYSIENIKTGLYDIVFSKDSFSTFKIISCQFIGGKLPSYIDPITLYKLPYFSINDLKVDTGTYSWQTGFVKVSALLNNSTSGTLRYYLSYSPDVSYTNYQQTGYIYVNAGNNLSYNFNTTALRNFKKGKNIYIILYPSSVSYSGTYIDLITGNTIYGVNVSLPSSIVSFVLPNTLYYN